MPQASLFAVTAIGKDRPGIVSAITEVLYELGCNLEDATSTILRGHFSITLIVRAPNGVDVASLERRLQRTGHELNLVISVRAVEDLHPDPVVPTHVISVYGADRPGIVYRVADLLAKTNSNITALSSHLIGDSEAPVYALVLEVALAHDREVASRLAELQDELGVDVTVRALDADVF